MSHRTDFGAAGADDTGSTTEFPAVPGRDGVRAPEPHAPAPPPPPGHRGTPGTLRAPRAPGTLRAPRTGARRAASSVLASTVVGVVLGIVGVLGIAAFSGQATVPQGGAVPADEAVFGGPEYGSRE